MASASKKEVKLIQVDLTLTELEAKVLIALLERVGGSPHKSYRGLTDGIRQALQNQLPSFSAWTEGKNKEREDQVASGSITMLEGGKFHSDK